MLGAEWRRPCRIAFSINKKFAMNKTASTDHVLFTISTTDSEMGVSRETLSRLVATLGMNETQVLHHALRQLARAVLPAYEADDGPLSAKQWCAIRKAVPKRRHKSIKRSLF